jgi:DNA-binding NarL/FixJ family response regulator
MSDHVLEPAAPADNGSAPALRLLVVDADARTRESMVGILGIRRRFRVIGSTGDVAEAISLVRDQRPDVVIVDPRLPEVPAGIALIRRIRAIDPATHVLAVGWSPDLENAALTAGAHRFMRKSLKPGDLDAAVAQCMADDRPNADPDPTPARDPVPGPGLIL